MEYLSERLEIRLHPDTMRLLREEARQNNVSVAQVVRQAIASFLNEDRQSQLQAAWALFQVEAPADDWDQMKREIEDARAVANG